MPKDIHTAPGYYFRRERSTMADNQAGRDAYAEVLADLRKRRDEIDVAIRALEILRGAVPSGASSAPSDNIDAVQVDDSQGPYLGMSIAEASKKLLAARRRTMNSGEIAQGLEAGGLHMTAVDPSNVIGSVLTRRFYSVGDIVRVTRGQWGLAEWYPGRSFKKKNEGKFANRESDKVVSLEPDIENPAEGALS